MSDINWDNIDMPDLPKGWSWYKGGAYFSAYTGYKPTSGDVVEWSRNCGYLFTSNESEGSRYPVQVYEAVLNVRDQILGKSLPNEPEESKVPGVKKHLAQVTRARYGVDPTDEFFTDVLTLTLGVRGLFGEAEFKFRGDAGKQVMIDHQVASAEDFVGKLCGVGVEGSCRYFVEWFTS